MRSFITSKKQYKMQGGRSSGRKASRIGRQAIVCLFWLALWQAAAVVIAKPLILPGPWETLTTLVSLAGESTFYFNIFWTLLRCLLAMALSFSLGCLCAYCAYRLPALRSLLTLPVGFFKAVPVMAIVIYVILVASADWVAVIVCFLMCFPIVYTNVLAGLDDAPEELLELASVYELSAGEKVRYIYAPAARVQVEAAVWLIAGMSWKAVVAAEVLSIPRYSLGYEMLNAKYYLQTPVLFAYIAVIVILSLAAEKLISLLLDRSKPKGYRGSRLTLRRRGGAGHKNAAAGAGASVKCAGAGQAYGISVSIDSVTKSFGEKAVLKQLELTLAAGRVSVLMGPSGGGKTTLARLIAGLETPDSGRISFARRGQPCARPQLAYLFQEDRLLPWLNVYDNMALAFLRRGGADFAGTATKEGSAEQMIKEMAAKLELQEVIFKLPDELSGGMKHRVALGRTFLALEAGAELAIFDEPFRGLDRELKKRLVSSLWSACTSGRTVLLITHDEEDGGLGDVKLSWLTDQKS